MSNSENVPHNVGEAIKEMRTDGDIEAIVMTPDGVLLVRNEITAEMVKSLYSTEKNLLEDSEGNEQ